MPDVFSLCLVVEQQSVVPTNSSPAVPRTVQDTPNPPAKKISWSVVGRSSTAWDNTLLKFWSELRYVWERIICNPPHKKGTDGQIPIPGISAMIYPSTKNKNGALFNNTR